MTNVARCTLERVPDGGFTGNVYTSMTETVTANRQLKAFSSPQVYL